MKVRSPTRALCAWLGCCAISILPGVFGSTDANAADPIKIGAVLPFSGGVELYGAQAKLGLDLAAADINAAGGILGRPVEIVYRDDGTRPNIATEAARRGGRGGWCAGGGRSDHVAEISTPSSPFSPSRRDAAALRHELRRREVQPLHVLLQYGAQPGARTRCCPI